MQSDLGLLKIRKVILHDVPRHTKNPRHIKEEEGGGPILSEVESPLTARQSLYFKDKIINSIKSPHAFDITFAAATSSPVPDLVVGYLTKPKKPLFIKSSQELAKHLYNIQTGQNPPGVLAVVDCLLDDKQALAIVKLEREEGIQLELTTIDEKKTFGLRLINDLIFTQKTKVYKVSLFIALDEELKIMEAAAVDLQTGYQGQTDVAKFFLSKFLGCTLFEAAIMTTRMFFELSEQFFNEKVDDPIKRTRYYSHLVSAMESEKKSVSPEDFAVSYLERPDRKPFLDYIKSQGLTASSFPLDTKLIDRRLKRRVIEFENGVSIVISGEDAEDRVKYISLPNREVKIEISGVLKTIKAKL